MGVNQNLRHNTTVNLQGNPKVVADKLLATLKFEVHA